MNAQGPEGKIFAGKYKIIKPIGRGGMANVYLATDMGSGVKVAIKILKPEFSADEEFIRRFDTEAKAVSSLNHANIVKVFGVGHEGSFRYIVQEYVDGITVKDLINQNGHLDWNVAVPIVIQVGMALEYAHRNGIIHKDIKPQNILISRDRIAKITDFGIARAASGNTITMSSGGAVGSVHYFSPEQARGNNVGPASDIYSVGVMLFEMVTGRVPFDGDSDIAIAVKHLQDPPPLASNYVPDIPHGLDSIIVKCMQKTPDKRYSSMRQMVTELDALMVDPNGVYGVINAGNEPVEQTQTPGPLSFRQDPNYDKISDLEKSAEARRLSRLRDNILLIFIVLLILGVLVGVSVLILNSISTATHIEENSDYTVGNYIGRNRDEVILELEANRISYDIETVVTSDYAPGTIIGQNINEGVVIASGSDIHKIVLTVAGEAETITLSNYAGLDYHEVYAMLSSLGLQVSVLEETNSDFEPGQVLRTEPVENSVVEVGSSIVIVYAKAPSSSTVPVLSGLTLEEARELLEEEELNIGHIEGSTDVLVLPENQQYVILTDPVAGITLPRRSSITLYIGTLEDVERGGTPTPTPSQVNVVTIVSGQGTAEGGGAFDVNTTVTLVATPAEGYRFARWLDPYNNVVTESNVYTFVVYDPDGDPLTPTTITYTAVFEPIVVDPGFVPDQPY
ncbi:MAG: Stk1 family PASTA domain-containing Ser/Thr kinase [Clostridiales bacterium]|nr:Stk1 family PASTA domain-containing Ser/Thr kinase [Clostridiales bacterium]